MLVINLSNFKTSLQTNIFFYLGLFSLSIVASIWLFQLFFINIYYEKAKTDELKETLYAIKTNFKDDASFYESLENYSLDKGICTEIIKNKQISYTTNPNNRGCNTIFDRQIQADKVKFLDSNSESFQLVSLNKQEQNKTLIIGLKIDKDYAVFVNTSIVPIDSTVQILRRQFVTITFIVLIISFIVAYCISKIISKPITKLTTKSLELSKGNFDVDFDVNANIYEIDDLANSLNYSKDVLKKNDELRREIMANVSHDLKTPLTMIKAYSEKIRDLTGDNEIKRNEDLTVISDEVDRLNILVNDILTLSQLENNIQDIKLEEIDLSNLVDTIINRFKIFSITQDFIFTKHYDKNIKIVADKQKMEQVIYNLIGNAINYTNDNKHVYITILNRKKEVIVFITDTGPGISKAKIKNIWDKYYKIDKKYKRNTVGTGLGLSIVRHIFEQHHYKYGVNSKENLGTTFYFIIKKQKYKK